MRTASRHRRRGVEDIIKTKGQLSLPRYSPKTLGEVTHTDIQACELQLRRIRNIEYCLEPCGQHCYDLAVRRGVNYAYGVSRERDVDRRGSLGQEFREDGRDSKIAESVRRYSSSRTVAPVIVQLITVLVSVTLQYSWSRR